MDKKPHIVIIMADQLRYDVLGKGFTPTIDNLARESVVFENAYTASALCVPARGAFFTGTYPCENGCLLNSGSLDAYVTKPLKSLYELLENDWDSWHSGKQHYRTYPISIENRDENKTNFITLTKTYHEYLEENKIPAPGGPAYRGICPETATDKHHTTKTYSLPTTGCYEGGFDAYFDGYFAKGAVEAIQRRNRNKPLLLNAMFLAPHPPFDIPEPYYSMVDYDDFELPENVGSWYDGQSPLQLYHLPGFWGTKYTKDEWREIWRVYLGLVSLLDRCVQMIIDELKAQDIYDDTLIIFSSDHGEMLGSHRLWQKMCLYEESIKIPLMFKFPKKEGIAPRRLKDYVSAVDVFPTICDFIQYDPGHEMSGASLMETIRHDKEPKNRAVFSQYDGNKSLANAQRCIIEKGYKLIISMFGDLKYLELYNLEQDPQETENLILLEKDLSIAEDLLKNLICHMKETNDIYEFDEDLIKQFLQNVDEANPSIPLTEII
ncbi:MAG: sulfatase-like hydrolase/transferase [Clostridiales bacterium]|nr:sulfatase-like hydrolase/transferase [Clostridiales bacterium]